MVSEAGRTKSDENIRIDEELDCRDEDYFYGNT